MRGRCGPHSAQASDRVKQQHQHQQPIELGYVLVGGGGGGGGAIITRRSAQVEMVQEVDHSFSAPNDIQKHKPLPRVPSLQAAQRTCADTATAAATTKTKTTMVALPFSQEDPGAQSAGTAQLTSDADVALQWLDKNKEYLSSSVAADHRWVEPDSHSHMERERQQQQQQQHPARHTLMFETVRNRGRGSATTTIANPVAPCSLPATIYTGMDHEDDRDRSSWSPPRHLGPASTAMPVGTSGWTSETGGLEARGRGQRSQQPLCLPSTSSPLVVVSNIKPWSPLRVVKRQRAKSIKSHDSSPLDLSPSTALFCGIPGANDHHHDESDTNDHRHHHQQLESDPDATSPRPVVVSSTRSSSPGHSRRHGREIATTTPIVSHAPPEMGSSSSPSPSSEIGIGKTTYHIVTPKQLPPAAPETPELLRVFARRKRSGRSDQGP